MRVAIREQLAGLVILAVLVALAVVSIPTWVYVNRFVGEVESSGLALTASLKAARISSEIELIQTTCQGIATRILIQQAFINFYNGNTSAGNWDTAGRDLETALSAGVSASLLQARLYSRNTSGDAGGVLNITGRDMLDITLPYTDPSGNPILLGDSEFGYPPMLYPNITYNNTGVANQFNNSTNVTTASPFPGVRLANNGGLVLGPLMINATFALMSLTVPVRQIGNSGFILGYMTLIASGATLINILQSREGLGETGVVLVIGPDTPWNRYDATRPPTNDSYRVPDPDSFGEMNVHFIFPPHNFSSAGDRHSLHDFGTGDYYRPFQLDAYPTVQDVFTQPSDAVNDAASALSTTNEQGYAVAVGVARPATALVNWAVVIEQDRNEAYAPIVTLRNILLGCVFGTAGLVLLLIFPCAHLSVKPIRQLKAATEQSIAPPGYSEGLMDDELPSSGTRSSRSRFSEKGWFTKLQRMMGLQKGVGGDANRDADRQVFKIPGKVPEKKHFVTDELTELTATFNAMSDELLKQYESLDEKVAERTRELEISKKAAEAANESKTLFIANISHELKTPLNGIMGMCAVCMEEDDVVRIKQSLKTLYKSGDLLLHLLEDLLSFSKNQIGHQVNLEEKEFRLGDIRSQTLSIFDKQVREGRISFSVEFLNSEALADLNLSSSPERPSTDRRLPALGPAGAGRLKDMCLWGDQHRILQVIINLVSNSLKFTPPGGKVQLRIRCLGEADTTADDGSRTSSFSKTGSNRAGRPRHRLGSSSTQSASSKGATSSSTHFKGGTALSINPMDPRATPHIHIRERSPTPPPLNAKPFIFEFEVEDSGPGIPPHMLDKVFEPFVQGDLGLSKKFGGTGLGLSICQQLANLMGGTIGLKSTVGVGTTFSMHIPLRYVKDRASSTASSSMKSRPPSVSSQDGGDGHRNSFTKAVGEQKPTSLLDKQPRLVGLSQPFFAANPHPTPSKEDQIAAINRAMANKAGAGKLRVLVADDNSTNIEVVSKMLKLEDIYDVTIAKDGQEAYDLVKANMERNQRFDVIFMDIQMPNLDGLQSTRLIRKMGYSAPIVALTAFSEESNVKECMESGMDEFLSKPIRRPALKQVLQKFATIPEEPETASLTRKTTPDNKSPAKTPQALDLEKAAAAEADQGPAKDEPQSNGVSPLTAG